MKGRLTCWSFWMLVLFVFVLQPLGFAEERHTVKPGDNLYKISKLYGISVGALKASNHLEKENLRLNQVLLIPTSKENEPRKTLKKSSAEPSSYVVKRGDSLSAISRKVGLSVDEIKQINHLRANNLTAGQTLILSVPRTATGDPDEESGDDEDVQEALPDEEEGGKEAVAEPAPGGWKSQEERNLFVRVVKNFLGVPYRLGGSTLKGIDCSAFVKRIYEIFNTQLPRTTWEQLRIGKKVGKGDLEEGDLVFFKVPTRRASNRHVGIYIGNNEFVHASSRKREVRVDSLEAPYFSKRFINGIRVKELDRKI